MKKWIQLVLKPRDYKELMEQFKNNKIHEKPSGSWKELISYLKTVVDSLTPEVISRYFYTIQFSEQNPHLPLSLELKNGNEVDLAKKRISEIKIPKFIESFEYNEGSHDESNGEGTINFLNAIKNVSEVCNIFCATANPTKVIVDQSKINGEIGRGIVGVIDGFSPKGVENKEDFSWRKKFLRDIKYKL